MIVQANGIPHLVAEHGSGDPVLLLHGGLESSTTWAAQIPALAERYRDVTIDRRGHGGTPDPGPIDYPLMADDTAAVLAALGIERARLVGFSDGAIIGLLLATGKPQLVERLVSIGGNSRPDGIEPWFARWLEKTTAESFPARYREEHERLSPDGPGQWPAVFEKVKRLWAEEPWIADEELAGIKAPTLVLAGDRDIVTPAHTVALARTIPDAQLGIVPGTTHAVHEERPEVVNRLLLDFFAA